MAQLMQSVASFLGLGGYDHDAALEDADAAGAGAGAPVAAAAVAAGAAAAPAAPAESAAAAAARLAKLPEFSAYFTERGGSIGCGANGEVLRCEPTADGIKHVRAIMALEFGGDAAAAAKEPLGTFLFKRPKGGARMAASRDKRVEAEREVKALSEWRHRHIVRFYGAFRDTAHGVAVLVLEAAEGARDAHGNPDGPLVSSLSDADRTGSSAGDFWRYIATRHTLPVWHVKMLTFQVLSAVAYLHRKGVVHRDLKTENLLVLGPVAATKRGPVPTVKVCDFGSARLMPIAQQLGVPLNVAYSAMTVYQVVPGAGGQRVEKYQGTLQFVAPEIWRAIHAQAGEISHAKVDDIFFGNYGPAADIYSLGITVWFMATRAYPFPTNIAQRAFEDLATRGSINFDALAAQVGEGGSELAAFLRLMLAPEAAKRATADALLAHKFFDDVRAECREHFGSELP